MTCRVHKRVYLTFTLLSYGTYKENVIALTHVSSFARKAINFEKITALGGNDGNAARLNTFAAVKIIITK